MNRNIYWLAPIAAMAFATSVQAKEIKIGFVTTLTTPAALMGKHQKAAVDIAMDHIGHKMGGLNAKVVYEDDAFSPKIGKQKTEKLLKKNKVDIFAGYIWSHVLAASAPVVLKSGKIFISSNAGHSLYAGKKCHKNFFNAAWENSQNPRAMGELLNKRGVKSLYVMSPNYAAGKQMVTGVKATFKGKILGTDMTPWPSHADWSAEFAKVKAAKPDGVFVFYPGAAGPKFLTQYKQSGLSKSIPLYTVFTIDGATLPFFQKAGLNNILGTFNTMFWAPDLDNAANKRFVADFKKKTGDYPSHYAAQAYDTILLIKSAVDSVRGNIGDTDAMRAALEKADYASIRGAYKFGKNHFPIQNFYSREVVADKNGQWMTSVRGIAKENFETTYAKDCKL